MFRNSLCVAAVCVVGACALPAMESRPGPPVSWEPTAVQASFDKTWNAVIDATAARNIPIASMEKASGFIALTPLEVSKSDGLNWADCGTFIQERLPAARVVYNVVVRSADNARTTVRVNARWTTTDGKECSTKGVWERGFETFVKERAER